MGYFGMCSRCAWRYCGVPDPRCATCAGTGRIDGGDLEDVDALVVLRAALMALDEGVPRARLIEAKLLGEPGSGVLVEPPIGMGGKSAVGRAAGQLLRDMGIRKATNRKVLTKEDRDAAKRAKAAKAQQMRLASEHHDRARERRAEERRLREIETRAALAIAQAHPEDFEAEREAQEVFVALEQGLPDVSYALHRSAGPVRR